MKCSGKSIALATLTLVGLGLGVGFAIPASRGALLHFFGKMVPQGTKFAAHKINAFYSHHTGNRVATTLVGATSVTALGVAIVAILRIGDPDKD